MYTLSSSEEVVALANQDAIRAGENARIQLELEEGGFLVEGDSIRRRLARTLVQLGMRIDPMVRDEANDEA